jgi:hypothetical protein
MGFFWLFYPWGIVVQALAIVHFFRRRPETFWLFVIFFLGPPGALIYILLEVVPDLGLLRHSFEGLGRRKRIGRLEAIVTENPSPGNYEELGDLYLEERHWAKARACYDRAITPRTPHPDPVYRRAIAALEQGDFPAAVPDLERVTADDAKYDSYRALGLLAHAYAQTGQTDRVEPLFRQATEFSTLSETYYNFAGFLASQGRADEAREWAERILAKKATMPRYVQRRERPWLQKASALLKSLPRRG